MIGRNGNNNGLMSYVRSTRASISNAYSGTMGVLSDAYNITQTYTNAAYNQIGNYYEQMDNLLQSSSSSANTLLEDLKTYWVASSLALRYATMVNKFDFQESNTVYVGYVNTQIAICERISTCHSQNLTLNQTLPDGNLLFALLFPKNAIRAARDILEKTDTTWMRRNDITENKLPTHRHEMPNRPSKPLKKIGFVNILSVCPSMSLYITFAYLTVYYIGLHDAVNISNDDRARVECYDRAVFYFTQFEEYHSAVMQEAENYEHRYKDTVYDFLGFNVAQEFPFLAGNMTFGADFSAFQRIVASFIRSNNAQIERARETIKDGGNASSYATLYTFPYFRPDL